MSFLKFAPQTKSCVEAVSVLVRACLTGLKLKNFFKDILKWFYHMDALSPSHHTEHSSESGSEINSPTNSGWHFDDVFQSSKFPEKALDKQPQSILCQALFLCQCSLLTQQHMHLKFLPVMFFSVHWVA